MQNESDFHQWRIRSTTHARREVVECGCAAFGFLFLDVTTQHDGVPVGSNFKKKKLFLPNSEKLKVGICATRNPLPKSSEGRPRQLSEPECQAFRVVSPFN